MVGFIVDNTNDITGKLTCTVVNKKRTDKVHHTLALPEEGLSGSKCCKKYDEVLCIPRLPKLFAHEIYSQYS